MRHFCKFLSAAFGVLAGCSTSASHGFFFSEENQRVVDLTHSFDVDSPHWKGDPAMRRRPVYTVKKDGFIIEEYCHVGQWGTHLDPPAHFHAGMRTSDTIPASELILPLVVIDVHDKVEKNPDYTLSITDITEWEKRNGQIPKGSFVAMRTDWSKRWGSEASMQNRDERGVAHYPGWSIEALRYLYENRRISASGHETTDTDPGLAVSRDSYELESYILGLNRYQVELLANLDQVPEVGATVIVGLPKVRNGSGFPVRVLAVVAQ